MLLVEYTFVVLLVCAAGSVRFQSHICLSSKAHLFGLAWKTSNLNLCVFLYNFCPKVHQCRMDIETD